MKKVKLHNWLLIASRRSSTILVLIRYLLVQKATTFSLLVGQGPQLARASARARYRERRDRLKLCVVLVATGSS